MAEKLAVVFAGAHKTALNTAVSVKPPDDKDGDDKGKQQPQPGGDTNRGGSPAPT